LQKWRISSAIAKKMEGNPMSGDEQAARAFLESRGFREFKFEFNPEAIIEGLKCRCRLYRVWGPRKNWGHSYEEAARRALANNPVPRLRAK
jgi:hypothetical protein